MSGFLSTLWGNVAAETGAALLGWAGASLWTWIRRGPARDWEEVRELRTALDRALHREMRNSRRENALSTGYELLLIVMPNELTPEQRQAVERSRQLFETALVHHDRGEG